MKLNKFHLAYLIKVVRVLFRFHLNMPPATYDAVHLIFPHICTFDVYILRHHPVLPKFIRTSELWLKLQVNTLFSTLANILR